MKSDRATEEEARVRWRRDGWVHRSVRRFSRLRDAEAFADKLDLYYKNPVVELLVERRTIVTGPWEEVRR